MSLGAMSRANEAFERAIAYARRFGRDENGEPFYFIDLHLINTGGCAKANFCISGIDDLVANEPEPNYETGEEEYTFSKNKGGSIKFQELEPGLWTFAMWDTDYNREILASHYALGYWEILDEELDDIIRKRALEMEKEAKKIVKSPLEKEVEELNRDYKLAGDKDRMKILEKISEKINENANKILKPSTIKKVKIPEIRKRSRIRIPVPKKPEPIKVEKVEPTVDETPTETEKESQSTELVKVDE